MVSAGSEMEGAAAVIPAPGEARAAVSLVPDNLVAFALRAAGARAAVRTLDPSLGPLLARGRGGVAQPGKRSGRVSVVTTLTSRRRHGGVWTSAGHPLTAEITAQNSLDSGFEPWTLGELEMSSCSNPSEPSYPG